MTEIKVELLGQDELLLRQSDSGQSQVSVVGCHHLLEKVKDLRQRFGADPRKWELPSGVDHSSLLIKEFILKCQALWDYPYKDHELCHCRMVPTEIVDQAIVRGAHTPEKVSQMTSASTACGTCRPDVEKIINYRLKKV